MTPDFKAQLAKASGWVEPPAGYEKQLLAALHSKLPLASQVTPVAARGPASSPFWKTPWLAWSLAGSFAFLFVATVGLMKFGPELPHGAGPVDVLAQTVKNGGAGAVTQWVRSTASWGTAAHDGVDLENVDARSLDKAFDEVARQMGRKM